MVQQLLQSPAIAVQMAEGDVQDPRDPGRCGNVHPALGELGTRRIDSETTRYRLWTEPVGVATISVLIAIEQ